MKKYLSFCNIYILLFLLYNLQGVVFVGKGGIVSLLIIVFLILTSLYYTFYALSHYKMPSYMKGLTLLVLMFTIYGIILMVSGKHIAFMRTGAVVKNYNYIKGIYISLLPIFPFYVFTRQGNLTKEKLNRWTFVFFFTAIVTYFYYRRIALLTYLNDADDEMTNNAGYIFVALLPLLALFSDKRIVQYIGIGISMFFIIMGMKRGAIIIGAICILLLLRNSFRSASRREKSWVLILGAIVVLFGVYLVQDMLTNSVYFNQRLEQTLDGYSSGRDKLYSTFWNYYIQQDNMFRLLLGNGANATLTISVNYAHNDWLELLINQGVVGIVVYLFYWYCFYRTWKFCKKDNELYMTIGLSLIILLMKTFFSMSYGAMSLYTTICLGYCMGTISNRNQYDRCIPIS